MDKIIKIRRYVHKWKGNIEKGNLYGFVDLRSLVFIISLIQVRRGRDRAN